MSDLSVSGGSGSIDSYGQFTVMNTSGFTEFNTYLLGADTFTWRILGTVSVSALGRTANGLTLDKTVTYGGMAGFPGIEILNLTLPITQTPSQGVEMDSRFFFFILRFFIRPIARFNNSNHQNLQ